MRKFAPLILATVWLAIPAHARVVDIRSGEHEGFTRLVFYIKATDTFEISRIDEGYLLSLSPGITGFNLTRAFDLINRMRIRALVPAEDGKIAIQQACNCHLQEFRLPTGELVVDVVDGVDPDRRPVAAVSAPPWPRNTKVQPQRARLPLIGATSDQSAPSEPQLDPLPDSTVEANVTVSDAPKIDKQELLTQLSRAASQGLIDANVSLPDVSRIAAQTDTVAPTPDPLPSPIVPQQHVRMQTAIEQARADQMGAKTPALANHVCLPDKQFDIARWGTYTQETNAPVVEASNYLGEFDRPDRGQLVSHIRQLIYMTFGLEALQLIENYGTDLGDAETLRMMAEVVEHGEATTPEIWSNQIICNTRSALWAALGQPALPNRINSNAILRSFSELPPHLRAHLAPILARKLLNSGRIDIAVEVRNVAKRTGQTPSGVETMLEINIDLAKNQVDKAEQGLSKTIQTDLSQTQPAISTLIQSKLQRGKGISDSELTLLASVTFEHRGTEAGHKLQRLYIRALFHMSRFAQAFELLDSQNEISLLDEAGQRLLSLGSDADFLTFSLSRSDWGSTSSSTRLKMAVRLENLGFAEHARRMVLSGRDAPDRTAREFLARIAIKQDKPKVALGYLAGLHGDNAETLREAALKLSQGFDASTQTEIVEPSLNGGTNALKSSESAIPEGIRATLWTETPISSIDAQTDLQTYQRILSSSGETRAALTDLLMRFPTISIDR